MYPPALLWRYIIAWVKKQGWIFMVTAMINAINVACRKKKGCCSDEHKFYKINDSHKNVSNDLNFETPIAVITNTFPLFNFLLVDKPAKEKINNNSPPLYNKPSACVLNCIFRL